MSFILHAKTDIYYVAARIWDDQSLKWKTKLIRRATQKETEMYLERKKQDNVTVACANPFCDRLFEISREQKQFINTTNPRHRGTFEFMYCSKECQEAHLTALGVAEK